MASDQILCHWALVYCQEVDESSWRAHEFVEICNRHHFSRRRSTTWLDWPQFECFVPFWHWQSSMAVVDGGRADIYEYATPLTATNLLSFLLLSLLLLLVSRLQFTLVSLSINLRFVQDPLVFLVKIFPVGYLNGQHASARSFEFTGLWHHCSRCRAIGGYLSKSSFPGQHLRNDWNRGIIPRIHMSHSLALLFSQWVLWLHRRVLLNRCGLSISIWDMQCHGCEPNSCR
jgi:hypothetical protein